MPVRCLKCACIPKSIFNFVLNGMGCRCLFWLFKEFLIWIGLQLIERSVVFS